LEDFEHLIYAVDGGIATITVNRPERRNAQSEQTMIEMGQAFRRAEGDPAVRVIVLAGAGEHFSGGHDLKTAENNGKGFTLEERFAYEAKYSFDLSMQIWDAQKPTIASVQGGCVAYGFVLANLCDLIVAADDAFFSDPTVGAFGSSGAGTLVHPMALGLKRAKDLLYTGRRMGAQEAYDIGMVARLVPRAGLAAATLALADEIAAKPPFALRLVKRSLHRAMDIQGFRATLQAHFDTHQVSHVSEEFKAMVQGDFTRPLKRS
jgi:enoyl-CoA hydratase